MVGTTLRDTYEVYKLVARGGFGDIFLGRDIRSNTVVAIKTLHPEVLANPDAVRRFHREAELAQKLTNPHVVRVLAEGEVDGTPFLVMEYVQGLTLAQVVRTRGALPIAEAVDYVAQMLEALAEAHAKGIIHRDVKPLNVMVQNGVVKVMDFGIAKLDLAESLTESNILMGTPRYMAPEQAAGGRGDARSDLYAVAVTLYELLAGQPPFTTGTPVQVAYQQVHSPPPPITQSRSDLPAELVEVLRRGLAKDPAYRFQSAAAMREALTEALREDQTASAASVAETLAATALVEVPAPETVKEAAPNQVEVARQEELARLHAEAAQPSAAQRETSDVGTGSVETPRATPTTDKNVREDSPRPQSVGKPGPLQSRPTTGIFVLGGILVLLVVVGIAAASRGSSSSSVPSPTSLPTAAPPTITQAAALPTIAQPVVLPTSTPQPPPPTATPSDPSPTVAPPTAAAVELSPTPNATQDVSNDLAASYKLRGNAAYDKGDYDQALSFYSTALSIDPTDADTYYMRGQIYDAQNKLDLALADETKAIDIDPNFANAYDRRAVVYYKQNKLDLALADLNKAISLDPTFAEAYSNRGIVYADQNQLDQALADHTKAISLDPNDAQAYENRGNVYAKQGQTALALADYRKYLELAPDASDRSQIEQWITQHGY
jgi:serine/threonine-protein kinase